jgi:3alpha(or 20beta)-hydroxysteroid dehydrogenase
MGRLDGKVAIISGAARGQGAAEARAFVAEGASVVLGDVLHDDGKRLADELGDAARYVPLDVTDEDAWKDAVAVAVRDFGTLTTLVNNAGVSPRPKPIVDTSLDEYRRVIEINQIGVYAGMKFCAPTMTEAGGGSIVNISSVNGFVANPGSSAYVSSKFAVRGLTKTAALELGGHGIRVNSVHPGPIDTPMVQPAAWDGFDIRPAMSKTVVLRRLGQPSEVAELVVWLASDASSYCTAGEFVIDGGFLAGPPGAAFDKLRLPE